MTTFMHSEDREREEPSVFLIDDDPDLLNLVKLYVEAAGVAVQTFSSAEAFLDTFDPSRPGCLLLDIYMPGMSGLELQRKLVEQAIDIPVIIMTSQADVATAVQAMKEGAVDYIEKPLDRALLVDRLHECLVLDASRRDKSRRHQRYNTLLSSLTRREYEVMELLVAGKMNKVIAAKMEISQRTVEDHRAKVMEKLHAKSIADVVRIRLLSQY